MSQNNGRLFRKEKSTMLKPLGRIISFLLLFSCLLLFMSCAENDIPESSSSFVHSTMGETSETSGEASYNKSQEGTSGMSHTENSGTSAPIHGSTKSTKSPSQTSALVSSHSSNNTTVSTLSSSNTTASTSSRPSNHTTTSATSTSSTPSISIEAQTLGNTYYKLTVNKSLKVGYFGGSVTNGTGASNANTTSWRALTTAWLKEQYPSASITDYNAAIGGTGSLYGACRIKEDLLTPFNPDLIFVEFAINDAYQGYTQTESERYMESLVQTVYEFNPYADIVLVYTTDTGYKGKDFRAINAFNKVAAHYGLLTVNLGEEMLNDVGADAMKAGTYFSDYAHPNDAGYKKYASYIQAFLKSKLTTGLNMSKHQVPQPLRSDLLKNPSRISADLIQRENPDVGSISGTQFIVLNGESVTISFTGKTIMMVWKTSLQDNVTMKVDNGTASMLPHKNADGTQRILYDGLSSGTHTLTLENNSGRSFAIRALYVTN